MIAENILWFDLFLYEETEIFSPNLILIFFFVEKIKLKK